MKATVMVAHPDDCVIFAYSFMHHHPKFDWTVCYLTYGATDHRGSEFAQFWARRGVATKFLEFVDNWHDIENKFISFDASAAQQAILSAIADQDLVLTHNQSGDYGHLHHVFVNRCVTQHFKNAVTFQGPGQGNCVFSLDADVYSLDEFPLHKNTVEPFHINGHRNEYHVPQEVQSILESMQ